MYTYLSNNSFRSLLLLPLLVVLLCSACASGSVAHVKATPSPTQPITRQQILTGPITYVALGASDAVGVGTNEPGSQGYVPLLAARLPKGSHLVDLGISGIHLHEALARELPIALSTSPRLVTIWLVANDFVAQVPYDTYIQDLNSLLQQLRAGTQARLAMANLPDLTRLPAFTALTATQKDHMLTEIKRWNSKISALAVQYQVALVDLFSKNSELVTHPEYISGDGFHPSPAGYEQLANYFWQAITS